MAKSFSKKYGLTRDTLLKIAAAGGFIIAAGSSPYFLHAIARQFFKETVKKTIRARAKKLREMEKRKLISFQELGGGKVRIKLAHHGKTLVRLYNLEDMKLKIPKKWDASWRIIMYDIPSSKRKASDAFREKLTQLGLYKLQKSVWVSPYECLSEIEFLCAVFEINIDNCVLYFKTKEIPKEAEIKKNFEL